MNRRRAPLGGAALLLLFAAVAACGGSSKPQASRGPSASFAVITPSPSPQSTPFAEAPRDLLDLARRFRDYPPDGPDVQRTSPFGYQVGAHETFKLIAQENSAPYTVGATLQIITDHAYFFVEDYYQYDAGDLQREASDFESIVWPAVTSAFGQPWTPGVDGDPRITILHAHLEGAAGYVSGEDEYPAAAVPAGNQREMLYIDQTAIGSPGPGYNALAAHELQHLIHHNYDASEDSWVNEGLSGVAQEIAGAAPSVQPFLDHPETQLDYWPYKDDTAAYYAGSELFFGYLLDHYGGRDNANQLLSEQDNGIAGVNAYLAPYSKTFDDVFADFAVANLLDEPAGPYAHLNFDGTTSAVSRPSGTNGDGAVSQYGTVYLHFAAQPGKSLYFQGSTAATIGIPQKSGAFWWSGRMDGMDARLTREIDLTGAGSATLTFDEWFDTEPGWDFAYVAASEDGGATWHTLPGKHTTRDNPIGASYGDAYTGNGNGWISEEVNLGAYAGKKVLIRFETVNDDAVNLTGFAVDNIAVAQTGYSDTADSAEGWTAQGFRRVEGAMPQKFILQVIDAGSGVSRPVLDHTNAATIPLTSEVTVAISGATPDTTQPATYSWAIR